MEHTPSSLSEPTLLQTRRSNQPLHECVVVAEDREYEGKLNRTVWLSAKQAYTFIRARDDPRAVTPHFASNPKWYLDARVQF